MGFKTAIRKTCSSCGQTKVPHIVMEARQDSMIQCEYCGYESRRKKK